MTPESIVLIILALSIVGAAGLLLFGGWLIRHDLTRSQKTPTPRLIQDLRPLQNLVVDYFARTEPSARLLSALAANPHPLRISSVLRWAHIATDPTDSGNVAHSVSEWVALAMMRLAGLIEINKWAVSLTDVGREVHRRMITPPPSLDEQKPRRKSVYDSLFVPIPIDNSGSGHLERVREALRRNERNFIERRLAGTKSSI